MDIKVVVFIFTKHLARGLVNGGYGYELLVAGLFNQFSAARYIKIRLVGSYSHHLVLHAGRQTVMLCNKFYNV